MRETNGTHALIQTMLWTCTTIIIKINENPRRRTLYETQTLTKAQGILSKIIYLSVFIICIWSRILSHSHTPQKASHEIRYTPLPCLPNIHPVLTFTDLSNAQGSVPGAQAVTDGALVLADCVVRRPLPALVHVHPVRQSTAVGRLRARWTRLAMGHNALIAQIGAWNNDRTVFNLFQQNSQRVTMQDFEKYLQERGRRGHLWHGWYADAATAVVSVVRTLWSYA